ncbi:MAG: IclR family transcriptional regulator [Bacillota bacterium]|nr:IclR family transcriptional regulator [Bacillota bacterium]
MVETAISHTRERPVQSVERTLRILEIMAEWGYPMTLSEISNNLDLKNSTTHRLLKTLIMKSFAQQDPSSGKYLLGIKTFSIGNTALYALDIRSVARPYLKQLETRYKETANLAILDQGDVIYIDQVESERMVKMSANLGGRAPSHSNAVGKVLLAGLTESELERYFKGRKFERYTSNTITSHEALRMELEKVSQLGYGLDAEETEEGIRCVASAIYNHLGKATAAIGISGPGNRISMSYLKGELATAEKKQLMTFL